MKLVYPIKKDIIEGGKKIFDNDTVIKAIFVPVLGIVVPNLTGLITNELYPFPILVSSYVLFVTVAWATWSGNVKLMIVLKNNMGLKNKKYFQALVLLLGSVSVYTIVFSGLTLSGWRLLSKESPSYMPLVNTVIFITALAIFITSLYENFFLNKEHADTLSRVEQLNLAKTHVELVALKNQIDPHFIFNSLNTLSYLILSNPVSAKLYNDTLAKVYHYILMNKEKNLVLLIEEIEFMTNYFYLLKIRFDNALNMLIEINDTEAAELLIPPISLQILMENVMKHNKMQQDKPLTIHITINEGTVVMVNEMNPKPYPEPTPKVGLVNLDNRYKLLTGKNISIQQTTNSFSVKLPLINLN